MTLPSFAFQKNSGVICELPNADLLSKEEFKFVGFFSHSLYTITEYSYLVKDSTNEVIKLNGRRYLIKEITEDYYEWDYHQLNRKTLKLNKYQFTKEVMTYNCNVYSNENEFKNDFDKIKDIYLEAIKKGTNKI